MDLANAHKGYAFEGDYPEVYDDGLGTLQGLLRRQFAELERDDSIRDVATLGFLRGRRCSQRDLLQIEVPDPKNPRVLVAGREIMVRADKWSVEPVRDALREAGFNDRGVSYGSFVRLVNNRTRQPAIRIPAAELAAAQGLPNTLGVTASVGKGVGGPDPVANPLAEASRDFRNYILPGARQAHGLAPVVAVIDTGIPGKQEDGLPTMNRTDGWLDDVPRSDGNRDLLDYLPQRDGYLDYQAGHGTFVTGIVQRVAPTARIRVYRAADTDGFADDVGIADALRRAVEDGARIVNLSLGMVTRDNQPPPALEEAIQDITETHRDDDRVVIVAAAGNLGDSTPVWPAAFGTVEAVGALIETEDVENGDAARRTGKFEPAKWSSKGKYINFWTVAEGVRSTFVTGYESPAFDRNPDVFPQNAWVLWSGTSFAAPQIAGAIARISDELGVTPHQAVELLRKHGAPVDGEVGKAVRILSGIPRQ